MTEKDFISFWKEKLSKDNFKKFPDDFVENFQTEILNLPGTTLTLGGEIFGSYEILDTRGNSIFLADDLSKAKFILYGNKNKPVQIKIPIMQNEISDAVKNYEKYLDSILKEIEADYKKKFPAEKNYAAVSSEIFNLLNLKRY